MARQKPDRYSDEYDREKAKLDARYDAKHRDGRPPASRSRRGGSRSTPGREAGAAQ